LTIYPISHIFRVLSINDIAFKGDILMGRPPMNVTMTSVRLADDTRKRIDKVLENNEKMADFIRAAVERELKRRERGMMRHLPE
jgi:hypothetical protein